MKKQGPSRKAGPIEEEEPLVSRANSRMKEEHTKQNTPAYSQTAEKARLEGLSSRTSHLVVEFKLPCPVLHDLVAG